MQMWLAKISLYDSFLQWTLPVLTDSSGYKTVDFCLVNRDKPELMIEAKRSDPHPDRSILFFSNRYLIPSGQIVLHLTQEKKEKGIETRRGLSYLNSLQKMGGDG